jgi:hypothetical protein
VKKGSLVVIDTNVLLVANELHPDVSPDCVIACIQALDSVRTYGVVVIDDGYEILREYERRTSPNTGNQVGDAFLKWLYQNAGNRERVICVRIINHAQRGYSEFPDDDDLIGFDLADRKFVAVSAAHSDHPPILQATDSKWTEWVDHLSRHRIEICFLCPTEVVRFIRRKRSRKS